VRTASASSESERVDQEHDDGHGRHARAQLADGLRKRTRDERRVQDEHRRGRVPDCRLGESEVSRVGDKHEVALCVDDSSQRPSHRHVTLGDDDGDCRSRRLRGALEI